MTGQTRDAAGANQTPADGDAAGGAGAATRQSPQREPGGSASPAEFEQRHRALLELQGTGESDDVLAAQAIEFVRSGREIGSLIDDGRSRQHFQSVLDYWALAVYRLRHEGIDSDLAPFDHELAPTFDADAFPYQFDGPWDGHAEKLQGWRRLLDECERDLAGDHLLFVNGDVGSGVRTLVHGYLLPLLQRGEARLKALSGSDQWQYYQIELGQNPLRDLVVSIASAQEKGEQWIEQQAAELRRDPGTLRRILSSYSERPVLLAFHRFAALLETSAEQREAVCQNIAKLLPDPTQPCGIRSGECPGTGHQHFYVIATLRRGRSVELNQFGPLEKPLRNGHVMMGLTAAELRQLIEGPARRLGLVFEPGLIDQLLLDIQGEPTALPLLKFTLRRLWERRDRNRITRAAYQQTRAGSAALRIAMEEIQARFTAEEQGALRRMMQQMVKISSDGTFLPRPLPRRALLQAVGVSADAVLQRLQQSGIVDEFVTGGEPVLLLSQPALLVSWPPLNQWLDELRLKNHVHLRLQQAAAAWTSSGRSSDLLWRKFQLEEADHHLGGAELLGESEQQFLAASRRAERHRRWRWKASTLVVLITLILGVWMRMRGLHDGERRQQMYDNAVEHLVKGDVTGTLLWLDARQSWFSRDDSTRNEAVQKMRQIAWLQAPDLELLHKVGDVTDSSGSPSGGTPGDANKFESLAVLPHRYLAVVESASAEQQRKFTLQVHPLMETGAGKAREPIVLGSSQTPPLIALTSIDPSPDAEAYLLALQPSALTHAQLDASGAGRTSSAEGSHATPIRAWACDRLDEQQKLQQVALSFGDSPPQGRIDTFAVSGQWLFLAGQETGRKPDWRIWKLERAGKGLQLVEHARLQGPSGRRIAKAYLVRIPRGQRSSLYTMVAMRGKSCMERGL